jgi:hypothetical protein
LVKGLLWDKDKELLGNEELRAEFLEKMKPVSVDSDCRDIICLENHLN